MPNKQLTITQIRARQRRKGAKEKAKVLRRYTSYAKDIDLRKPLTDTQLRRIELLFSEYTDLTSRPHKIVRSRKKKNLEILQQFSQHETKGFFKVAFVPTADIDAKIAVRNNDVIIRNKYVIQKFSYFDMAALVANPEKEIDRAFKRHPRAKSFIVKTGEYYYNGPMPRAKCEKTLMMFMARYSPGGIPYEKRGPKSHFKNWLIGLETYEYTNQDDLDEYVQKRGAQREKILREKKNERSRYNRYFGGRVNAFKK